jgi:hypothetical protein
MKRRINYTGRKRIDHARAQLELVEQPDKPMKFAGHLDLTGLGLPETAHVIVEAYHKESTQRFECGTVGHIQFPDDTALTEVDVAGSYLFRVKVVDREGNGSKLIASAEKIQPKEPGEPDGNRDFLLKVISRENTGGIPWKLELDPDGNVKPILVINTKIGSPEKMRTNPVFRALILPAAIREVLNFIFQNEDNKDPDEGSWQAKWLSFAADLTNGEKDWPTNDDGDITGWVNDVVSGFSTRHVLCEKLALAEEVTGDA